MDVLNKVRESGKKMITLFFTFLYVIFLAILWWLIIFILSNVFYQFLYYLYTNYCVGQTFFDIIYNSVFSSSSSLCMGTSSIIHELGKWKNDFFMKIFLLIFTLFTSLVKEKVLGPNFIDLDINKYNTEMLRKIKLSELVNPSEPENPFANHPNVTNNNRFASSAYNLRQRSNYHDE